MTIINSAPADTHPTPTEPSGAEDAPPPPPVCERCRDTVVIDLDGNVLKARGEDYPA